MVSLVAALVYCPITVFARHIQQRVVLHQTVQVVRCAQQFGPLLSWHVVLHQYGILGTVTYLVHLGAVHHYQRRSRIVAGHLVVIGSVLGQALTLGNIVHLHQSVLVEQHQELVLIHLQVL